MDIILTGQAEATLVNTSVLDLIHPQDRIAYKEREREESSEPFKMAFVRMDSPFVEVHAELQFLHQKNGYDNCIVLVIHEWKPRSCPRSTSKP
jgi:hypothetical protein